MTQNGNLKRRARARAAKTGEAYTAALRHVRQAPRDLPDLAVKSIRLAVAQTTLFSDPRDAFGLRAIGAEMRCLMLDAHRAGARLVHFPEGATCSPHKRVMSRKGLKEIGPSDWSRFQWSVLHDELETTRRLARELELWTVFGSVHPLTLPHRPYNSLYVVSDQGQLVTRYDERMLSNTKISFMYSPGKIPITFQVDGMRFGCAPGMETHYPEIFIEYEGRDVDCVLFSTTGESPAVAPAFAAEVLGHAASNSFWISYAAHAPQSATVPSGVAAPDGQWAARCPAGGAPSLAIVDVKTDPGHPARPWRRTARSDLYAPHQVSGDPRSEGRNVF